MNIDASWVGAPRVKVGFCFEGCSDSPWVDSSGHQAARQSPSRHTCNYLAIFCTIPTVGRRAERGGTPRKGNLNLGPWSIGSSTGRPSARAASEPLHAPTTVSVIIISRKRAGKRTYKKVFSQHRSHSGEQETAPGYVVQPLNVKFTA